MTRKMAITIAGALIAAMMAGVVALSLHSGIVGPPAARAAVAPKPIVKTDTRVITIRKRRPARAAPLQTVTVDRPSPGSSAAPQGSGTYHEDDAESQGETEHGDD
jgi:hypothetical protein